MTRRAEPLIPLTHDHHHALVQARRLVAAREEGPDERSRVAAEFIRFFDEHTLLHFHEEEEVLFPILLGRVDDPPPELVEVLVQHVRIHGLVRALRAAVAVGAPSGDDLARVGKTLQAHVRLEENRLFPLIEREVPPDELARASFAPRSR